MEKSINKMGTMPVNKLMLTLGAPMISCCSKRDFP